MLTDHERAILELGSARYAHAGARITDMRVRCGMGEVEFWLAFDRLVDDVRAEAEMPAVVRRQKALREARRAARRGAQHGATSGNTSPHRTSPQAWD